METAIASDTDLAASWSTTTDSGLAISVSFDIDGPQVTLQSLGTGVHSHSTMVTEAMGVGAGDADSVV